ncbi:T9SS type A sorting domain-containing protein [Candidatus Marinimicrobia bacterium]|nr:T9SS type A sorting domain-containing protein [Candidatus Neomarinimicrobiota bacterium]
MNILRIRMLFINMMVMICLGYATDIHAPNPFKTIMTNPTEKVWTPSSVNTIENRTHVVFIDDTESYCLQVETEIMGNLSVGNVVPLKDGTGTYSDALRSMFQILDVNTSSLATDNLTGSYTIHPELASYYALDVEEDNLGLTVRDKSSFYHTEQDISAYLAFTIANVSGTSRYTLEASSRYVYNVSTGAFEEDNGWNSLWVVLNTDGTITLEENSNNATNWLVADSRDLIDVVADSGSDFNPQSTSWQTNTFAAYPTDANTGESSAWDYFDSPLKTNQFYNNVDEDYQNQLGHSDEANTAAIAVLNVIEQNLIDLGYTLRYSKGTYLMFRNALLNNHFASVDMYNSVLGERTVEHVYFTSAYSDDGDYHPFMVIATHNAPSGPQFLIDVARPPGDGTPGTSYDEQTITRNAILEQKLIKIPLRDYGLIDNLTDNDLTEFGSLASDQNLDVSDYNVDNYTSTSSTGIAVDGVIMYPSSNNVLVYATFAAEITSTGIHVGRGMGFHYHADGHAFNQNGVNLYNGSDYVDRNHPPIIGFVFDGVALFGKHDEDYPGMDGYLEELDDFGGHSHDDYGYHHHAFNSSVTQSQGPNTYAYTQNFLQRGAFKGKINEIPGFLEVSTNQFMNNEIKRYVGASGTSQLSIGGISNKGLPVRFTVYPNFPNPFNPTTQIRYNLPKENTVTITIFDLAGRNIRTLMNVEQTAGYHTIGWDASNDLGEGVAAGMYIYTIQAGEYRATKKMVLLK